MNYPFKHEEGVIYLETLFSQQNKWFVELLQNEFPYNIIQIDKINGNQLDTIGKRIFKLYFDSFNCNNFREILDESDVIIPFDIETANDLYAKKYNTDKVNELRIKINEALGTSLRFLKTLIVSPKASGLHTFPSDNDSIDPIKYLYNDSRCHNTLCLDKIDEDKSYNTNGIFIRNWNEHISQDKELRVYVIDHQIVGISQQLEKYSLFMDYYVRHNMNHIMSNVKDNIVAKVKFPRYCADIVVNDDGHIIPIEINPFYDWCNTGMCLFATKEDTFDANNPPFLLYQ